MAYSWTSGIFLLLLIYYQALIGHTCSQNSATKCLLITSGLVEIFPTNIGWLLNKNYSCFEYYLQIAFMQIYIDSIFPECEDVDEGLLNAANSIGLKEIPRYEVRMGEQCNWIKKTQVCLLSFFSLSQWYSWNYCYVNLVLFSYMLQQSFHPVEVTKGLWIVPEWSATPVWLSHSLWRFRCSNFSSFIGYPLLHCFCRSLMR